MSIKYEELSVDDINKLNIETCVSRYMIYSYAYYHLHDPLVNDTVYDFLAKRLEKEYDDIIDHEHKHFINREFAGSLFELADENYPSIVKNIARELVGQKNKAKR